MERKIGEVLNYDGEWYQCVKSSDCPKCDLKHLHNCNHHFHCSTLTRKDGEEVIFKKLEKVGEPYNIGKKVFQRYEVFTKPYIFNDEFFTINTPVDDSFISIEIKQNEDMEENNNAKHSNSENIGKKLKPFDLEAAKSGKPVCTRDGKKARIICFDAKDNLPIIALITNARGDESLARYKSNGRFINLNESDYDLMMLPEKKEGWVNVYHGLTISERVCGNIVSNTKEEAIQYAQDDDGYITTVKIEWEE